MSYFIALLITGWLGHADMSYAGYDEQTTLVCPHESAANYQLLEV